MRPVCADEGGRRQAPPAVAVAEPNATGLTLASRSPGLPRRRRILVKLCRAFAVGSEIAPFRVRSSQTHEEGPLPAFALVEGLFVPVVAGEGFEPSKALPTDLQSAPIGHSGNPPGHAATGDRGSGEQDNRTGGASRNRVRSACRRACPPPVDSRIRATAGATTWQRTRRSTS